MEMRRLLSIGRLFYSYLDKIFRVYNLFSRNVNPFDQANVGYLFHIELPLHVDCYTTGYGTLSTSTYIERFIDGFDRLRGYA